jgi:hypothetical protein
MSSYKKALDRMAEKACGPLEGAIQLAYSRNGDNYISGGKKPALNEGVNFHNNGNNPCIGPSCDNIPRGRTSTGFLNYGK